MHIVLYTHVSFQQRIFFFFFFNDTATTEIYTLSLHDALPISMIVAAVIGAWLGAGMVARAPRRFIQLGMGVALLVAAALMLAKNLAWLPPGGEALTSRSHTRVCGVRELSARRVDDAGCGPVCTVPHPREPARHESTGGLSDHDGFVRAADAGRRYALCAHAALPSRRRARTDARRHSRGAVRRLYREVAARGVAAVAGGGRGHVRGGPDAGLGATGLERMSAHGA